MKSIFYVPVAIIVMLGILVVFSTSYAGAQQKVLTEMKDGKWIFPAEWSNAPDRAASLAPAWGLGGNDPQQIIFTIVPDGGPNALPWPVDAFDFNDPTPPPDGIDVDALAFHQDILFGELIANRVNLLVSFQDEPAAPVGIAWVVYQEPITGGRSFPKWTKHDFAHSTATVDSLDALEMWGLELDKWDADYYSLAGDPNLGIGRVSIWIRGVANPYILHANIVAAVQMCGYVGPDNDIDLDALMVWDSEPDSIFNAGDTVIFSIRDTRPHGGNFDGGEIIVYPHSGGPATFLNHNGHLWNTAFNVTSIGVATEEVDAIEAFRGGPAPQQGPALTEWGLIILVALLVASAAYIMLRRKKAVVST